VPHPPLQGLDQLPGHQAAHLLANLGLGSDAVDAGGDTRVLPHPGWAALLVGLTVETRPVQMQDERHMCTDGVTGLISLGEFARFWDVPANKAALELSPHVPLAEQVAAWDLVRILSHLLVAHPLGPSGDGGATVLIPSHLTRDQLGRWLPPAAAPLLPAIEARPGAVPEEGLLAWGLAHGHVPLLVNRRRDATALGAAAHPDTAHVDWRSDVLCHMVPGSTMLARRFVAKGRMSFPPALFFVVMEKLSCLDQDGARTQRSRRQLLLTLPSTLVPTQEWQVTGPGLLRALSHSCP
jgi:hypothetical protein